MYIYFYVLSFLYIPFIFFYKIGELSKYELLYNYLESLIQAQI